MLSGLLKISYKTVLKKIRTAKKMQSGANERHWQAVSNTSSTMTKLFQSLIRIKKTIGKRVTKDCTADRPAIVLPVVITIVGR